MLVEKRTVCCLEDGLEETEMQIQNKVHLAFGTVAFHKEYQEDTRPSSE